jgi:GAF domain-containing protein
MLDKADFTEAWSEFTDVTQLSRAVVVAARRAAAADGATFVLRDEDRCFYAMEDAMSPLWQGQRFPIETCISGWAMLHGEVAIVPNIELDDRIPIEAYRPTFVRSLAMTPVGVPEPTAAIGVYWSRAATPDPDAVAQVAVIAAAAAVALDRIGLENAPRVPLQR